MNDTIEKTKALGKDSLIQLASSIMKTKYPNLKIDSKDFEITVWGNKKEVSVKYKRLIKYIPEGKNESDFIYNFSVNIISKRIIPFDIQGVEKFYIPTKKDIKNIEFVKEKFGLPNPSFDNIVSEQDTLYIINLENDVAFGKYFIDKKTGEETIGSIQGSYAPMPSQGMPIITDTDPLIEIKD